MLSCKYSMEGYNYQYSSPYPDAPYRIPDHGDGFADYYGPRPVRDDELKRWYHEAYLPYYCGDCIHPYYRYQQPWKYSPRPSCSKYRSRTHRKRSHSRGSRKSRSRSRSRSRSKSRSRSRSKSRSKSRSRSPSHSRSRSQSGSRSHHRELTYKEPSVLDAFRIMYLTPSKHKKSTAKYLVTKKKQDRVEELLKKDRLGSKHWLFYPRKHHFPEENEPEKAKVPGLRDNCDQRIKVDAVFFRKYKKNRKIDMNAPAAKLKRLELVLYKNLGFVQAI